MLKLFKKIQILLPPVLTNFLKKNMGYIGYAAWEHAPEGFKTKIETGGWALDSIASLQREKWPSYAKRIQSTRTLGINHESPDVDKENDPFFHNLLCSFAYVLALAGIKKDKISFLDWGGGIGHYGLLAQELVNPAQIHVDYYCYDFEVFGNQGKLENPTFHYFHNENDHQDKKFDLLMASSSIWYETDWRNGIDKLCKFDVEFMYITRMIFIEEHPSYVAIQRPKTMGYKTEYLFWIINKSEFLAYMSTKDFTLIREFEFGEVNPVFKAPEQGTMKGFLFSKSKHETTSN